MTLREFETIETALNGAVLLKEETLSDGSKCYSVLVECIPEQQCFDCYDRKDADRLFQAFVDCWAV